MESNSSNVIGVVRDFSNPFVETPADAKFIGTHTTFNLILYDRLL